jgi:N utilization substance protein B
MEKKVSFFQRRRNARQTVLQALYQWEMTHQEISVIENQFEQQEIFLQCDQEYFKEILNNIPLELEIIDGFIKRYIDRALEEMDPIEVTISRIATYELLKKTDVPYRVILNEALELAKKFGAQEGHKFVNGILDKIAREVRRAEIN